MSVMMMTDPIESDHGIFEIKRSEHLVIDVA